MTLPDLIVIGAGRSGTTSLHQWLGAHPQVFMTAEKSPNYFASDEPIPAWEPEPARAMAGQWVHDLPTYESLFDDVAAEQVVGEVSPVYLQATGVADRIRARCPTAKLVAVLRDPVDRAHAHYLGRRRDGIEPVASFEERIERELAEPLPDAVAFGHYLGCGRYHHFLAPYLRQFDRSQVRVYLYEDLVGDPRGLLADLFAFLGVDPDVVPDLGLRLNRGGEIRNPVKRALWTGTVRVRTRLRPHLPERLRRAAGSAFLADVEKPALAPALRARMIEVLRPDVEALQAVLDRDLSSWLEPDDDGA